MKQTILIFFSNFFLLLLQAQLSPQSNVINLFQSTPQSPVAGGIQKNIDVSVGYSTGTITPSINLFTIKAGNITVPITLSYNAGNGLKVDEKSGLVGMGWSISYGGTMNYQVNGLNDFNENPGYGNYKNRLYNTGNPEPGNSITGFVNHLLTLSNITQPATPNSPLASSRFLRGRIADGNVDGESDFIHYSLPAEKGGFMYYEQSSLGITSGEYKNTNLDGTISSFGNVLTKTGINYTFGLNEEYLHPYKMKLSNSPIFQSLYGPAIPTTDPTPIDLISAKYLTDISDPQTNRTVNYEYYKFKENSSSGFDMNKTFKYINPTYWEQTGDYKTRIGRFGDVIMPKRINFPNGYILFIYQSNSGLEQGVIGLNKTIREILVYVNNNLYKKIKFDYEDVSPNYLLQDEASEAFDILPQYLNLTENQNIYFLKSISEENNVNTNKIKYDFTYSNLDHIPARHNFGQDKYGYFNGQISNTTLIPKNIANPPFPNGADRSSYPEFIEYGILKEIKNPAGAITKFIYEPKVINNQPNNECDGLRIKEIITEDPNFKLNNGMIRKESKKFQYNDAFVLNSNPNYNYTYGQGTPSVPYIETTMVRLNATTDLPLSSYRGNSIMYKTVKEFNEINNQQNGLIKYTYENFAQPNQIVTAMNGVFNPKTPPNDRFNGKDIQTEVFKFNSNTNILELVNNTYKSYEYLKLNPEYIWNLEVAWANYSNINGNSPHKWLVAPGNDPYTFDNMLPDFRAYKVIKQELVETNITNKIYENGKEFIENTKNIYDQNNSNVVQQEKLNSRGDLIITKIKYPNNFSFTSNDPITLQIAALNGNNMLAMPIEKTTYIKYNNTGAEYVTSSQFYTYKDLKLYQSYKLELNEPTTNFVPAFNTTTSFFKDINYKLEMEVMKYDNFGNALELKNNKEMVTYIYGYGNIYPIAEVSNATYAQCAQILSGSPTAEINLNAYDGETLLIVLNSLRTNLPANTLVKTFAHKPMVGITIAEDANGLKQYFEYDEFNRLKIIKDKQGNILKKIDYQYQTPVIQ